MPPSRTDDREDGGHASARGAWLIRRACVLEDGVVHDEIEPLHISERDMAADILTKYLVFAVWTRHVHYITNRDGEMTSHPKVK